MIFLFIHGGPGLNSNPERKLLLERFSTAGNKIYFWNEPSENRKTYQGPVSFKTACDSLQKTILDLSQEEQITVIAHSFGAFTLNHILPTVELGLKKIILLCPVTDLNLLDQHILDVGEIDSSICMKPHENFSDERFEALAAATVNGRILSHYWNKQELLADYYVHFANTEYQFSLAAFKTIRETCHNSIVNNPTHIETSVIYGIHDPFILSEEFLRLKEVYTNANVYLFEESAHYCHIEEPEKFAAICFSHSAPLNYGFKSDSSLYVF
jgi:pimeloyl-ACP methyl ester carboxylesterase